MKEKWNIKFYPPRGKNLDFRYLKKTLATWSIFRHFCSYCVHVDITIYVYLQIQVLLQQRPGAMNVHSGGCWKKCEKLLHIIFLLDVKYCFIGFAHPKLSPSFSSLFPVIRQPTRATLPVAKLSLSVTDLHSKLTFTENFATIQGKWNFHVKIPRSCFSMLMYFLFY